MQVLIRLALTRQSGRCAMLKVVDDVVVSSGNAAGGSLLDEIVRDGARAMLAAALQAEVAAYIAAHVDEVDEAGRRLVVRNGYHAEREVATGAGALPVRAPRVNDRRLGSTTGASMRAPGSGCGSPRRSCRRGLASPPR